MDMDDDFMGEIEFDLSPEQGSIVSRAIDMAARADTEDAFASVNPLLAIMQSWQTEGDGAVPPRSTPEETLVHICRWFIDRHAGS